MIPLNFWSEMSNNARAHQAIDLQFALDCRRNNWLKESRAWLEAASYLASNKRLYRKWALEQKGEA